MKDRVSGVNGRRCSRCGESFRSSKLLYPVQHKDYANDDFIKNEWEALRWHLREHII